MDKDFFIAITGRLSACVPALRWVELDEGQLSSPERPSVAFPCALVDIAYSDCQTVSGSFGSQRVKATVTVRVAFKRLAPTAAMSPDSVRPHALSYLDTLQEIHKKALQWWNGNGLFNPLQRVSCLPEKQRHSDIKAYVMTYRTEFSD